MRKLTFLILLVAGIPALASVRSELVAMTDGPRTGTLELKNDIYNEAGGQAYLQLGFVKGEKAGVWVQVPPTVKYFKPDYFRVLISNNEDSVQNTQVFFQMGIAARPTPGIPAEIENAAQITAGPYWNDIPAEGAARGKLRCATGGEFVGAALEFTHDGAPSVFRDGGPIKMAQNTLFAIPGGWNYSGSYGLTGNWILRVVGREVQQSECQ